MSDQPTLDAAEPQPTDADLKRTWLDTYLTHLRPELRPDTYDPRFRTAAGTAYGNGWAPDHAASLVNAVNYSGAFAPEKVAAGELARICSAAPGPPRHAARERPAHQVAAHCGRAQCDCTHDHGCYKGWLDRDGGPSAACPTCRPALARRLSEIPAPGKRSMGDLEYLRARSDWR